MRAPQPAEIQVQQNGEGLSKAVLASPVIIIEVGKGDSMVQKAHGSTVCELSYAAPPEAKTLAASTARFATLSTTTIGWFS